MKLTFLSQTLYLTTELQRLQLPDVVVQKKELLEKLELLSENKNYIESLINLKMYKLILMRQKFRSIFIFIGFRRKIKL